MKKTISFKRLLLGLIIIFSIMFTVLSDRKASAAGTIKVDSLGEFFDKLSEQIYDRDAYRYYSSDDAKVIQEFRDFDMLDYELHYREDDPFHSGCYLSYYTSTLHMSISSRGTKVLIELPYNKSEMDRHFANLDDLAVRLKGKNDYETVVNVHDYLIKNFEYDSRMDMGNHTDIDGFRDGVMVCSGYALSAYYILNSAGVKTRTVLGTGDDTLGTLDHMWNVVKIDNKWYNLDITWDDLGGSNVSYEYFLKSDEDFHHHARAREYDKSEYPIYISKESYKSPIEPRTIKAFILILLFGCITFLIIFLKRDKRL